MSKVSHVNVGVPSVVAATRQSKGPPLTTSVRGEVDKNRKSTGGAAQPLRSEVTTHEPKKGRRYRTSIAGKGKNLINLPPEPKKRGRQSIKASMTPAEIAKEVKEFISDLRAAKDVDEKKRIRRALRLRGHYGGLGKTSKTSSPAKQTVAA